MHLTGEKEKMLEVWKAMFTFKAKNHHNGPKHYTTHQLHCYLRCWIVISILCVPTGPGAIPPGVGPGTIPPGVNAPTQLPPVIGISD